MGCLSRAALSHETISLFLEVFLLRQVGKSSENLPTQLTKPSSICLLSLITSKRAYHIFEAEIIVKLLPSQLKVFALARSE